MQPLVKSSIPSLSLRGRGTAFAREYLLSVLGQGVEVGALEIIEGDSVVVLGKIQETKRPARIVVKNDTVWWRIFTSSDLGFAESYMLGEFETDDLRAICDIWINNASRLEGLSTVFFQAFALGYKYTSALFGQSVSRAKLNAVAGYDGSNAMFQAFLSKEMMYSCALWTDAEGGLNGDLQSERDLLELEAAQKRKIRHVLTKARVKRGDRVLEFGSGWCGLAIEAVQWLGCTVDTLTLSVEQKKLGEERIRAAGLEDSIHVHLLDYRQLPPSFEKAFDAFVSVEMIEHVGPTHYEKYFSLIDWALKSKNAAAVITSSTCSEAKYTTYQTPDFSRYYMWPNGTLPSATALVQAANAGSKGRLQLDEIENHGQHYARTLREWNRRFLRFVPEIEEEIMEQHPAFKTDRKLFEAFKRKWLYLFPSAEAGFASGYLTCHMLTFIREMTL
ncbi:cyclopropane-fatty-acyl-phospholipid synthase [Punctularia strigosozonata HHB-11173 SS5]|uniref:cyclopropane-fatty-acyl-phospholipid synthase n=1 Tax=Punctularia strigosozonata (strain HHB-11173) TaxID=741275 RepID=UPI0004418502|nr:cyclopropane-fatty-acyl-phospholipid synthase [Punctularia strigosozonata HHB-11173 SS5]EIN10969.1 cyclopropane-fatty-acyl-phospholipid synthase [Punctularia strigosozonata HHB-11173 SS5]